jgi:hypothetical protein
VTGPARLRVYRFGRGASFEGEIVGALERIDLGGGTDVLDALFVTRDESSRAVDAVTLGVAAGDDRYVSLVDFRLDAGRRRALTERTLADHPEAGAIGAALEPGAAILAVLVGGDAPTVLDDAVARAGGRLVADEPVDADRLEQVGSRLRDAAGSAS